MRVLQGPAENDRRESWLPWIVALVVAAMFAVFLLRSYLVDSRADRTCRVLRTLIVEGGRPPANAPGYYAANPDELTDDQQQYDRAVSLLECRVLPGTSTASTGGS